MIYKLENHVVTLSDYRYFNIYQDRNPATQLPFEDQEAALAWACDTVCEYTGSEMSDVSVRIEDKSGATLDAAKYGEAFILKITSSVEGLTGYTEIDIVSEDGSRESYKVNFENSVAKLELIKDAPCKKYVQFNTKIVGKDKVYHLMQEAKQFIVEIL